MILAILLAAGAVSERAMTRARTTDGNGVGQVVAALAGGMRGAAADVLWLQAHAAWERRDWAGLEKRLRLVTTVNPASRYFWLNGARMIAYDVPAGRIEAARRAGTASDLRTIQREQAGRALAWLDAAERVHPGDVALQLERAAILWHRLYDLEGAAACYRAAAERPGAPYYAARLHAELLRRLGRLAEAHAWLCRLHPTLPRGIAAAQADLVLGRIRELERELRVPAEAAYRLPQE